MLQSFFFARQRRYWTDFYAEAPDGFYHWNGGAINESDELILQSETNIRFAQVLIYDFSSTAINVSTNCSRLLIEETLFYNCHDYESTEGGGVVYYNNNEGVCILNGVCAVDCWSNKAGSLAYIRTKGNSSFTTILRQVVAASCEPEGEESAGVIYTLGCRVNCTFCNISQNNLNSCSALWFNREGSLKAVVAQLTYSTIHNNTADQYMCLYFQITSLSKIMCCNIINNEQNNQIYGIITTKGGLYIYDSCIVECNESQVFGRVGSGMCYLFNCVLDDEDAEDKNHVIKEKATGNFLISLTHYETAVCANSPLNLYGFEAIQPKVYNYGVRNIFSRTPEKPFAPEFWSR